MGEYLFLYRGGEAGRSPEQMQQTMQKWMAWFKDLAEKGHIKDRGLPLEGGGKLVHGKRKLIGDPGSKFVAARHEFNQSFAGQRRPHHFR